TVRAPSLSWATPYSPGECWPDSRRTHAGLRSLACRDAACGAPSRGPAATGATDLHPAAGKACATPTRGPCLGDRVLQRSVADVLTAIDERDVLPGACGGRPGVGAHHALATVHAVIAGKPVSWSDEADLRNFLGRLDHAWRLRCVHHGLG